MTSHRRNRLVLTSVLAPALVTSACLTSERSTPTTTTRPPVPSIAAAPVPTAYQAEYQLLNGQLDAYQAAVEAMPDYRASDSTTPSSVAGAELLTANGNRQSQLPAPDTLTSVDHELDALRRLGVTGVTVGVKLPLLLPQFGSQATA